MFSTKQFILVAWAAFLVHCAGISPARERQGRVSGTVRTERNDPIEGVSITLKGTEIGASTNEAGEFAMDVPAAGGTLVFSYLGYLAQEQSVRGGEVLTVTLVSVMEDLDEVVVVGYGTMRKRDLTGAVASVQAQKLEAEAPRSVQDILRANASGLIIGQGNTAKGDANLLVRGSGTLKAGSSPLIVLDGVIFDGVLEDVNPNDIATIDILKDASATAVYGAKAANGVVLITTKRGASGKPKITLNGNLGFVENARFPRVMTAEEFLAYRYDYEMGKNSDSYHSTFPERFVDPRRLSGVSQLDWYNYDQQTPVSSVTEDQLMRAWLTRLELKTPEIDNYLNGKITDWQDLVFQQGFQQDYSVAVSNRTKDLNYYLSFNHVDREGVIVGNRFKNFRTRLNLETTIAPFLKVGTNSNFASRNEGFLQADWTQSAIISPYGSNNLDDPSSIYRRYPTGDVTPQNPFHDNFYRDRVDRFSTLNSTLYGVVTFPLGIEFQSNFTPSMGWREYYDHQSSLNPEWAAKGGESERRFERTHNWQIDNVLRWRGEFAAHRFEVTLLQNAEQNQFWKTTAKTSGYTPSDILGWHRMQAGTVPLNESDDTYNTGDALMGRLFYSFRERYMLTASVRRDGYSAFGAQNPRATFPALAFAWNFSEEEFAKPLRGWLDYGKLRLTWGENGNRDIGMYEALSDMTANPHPYIDQNGNLYTSSQLWTRRMANLGLRWERKASYNFGLDFAVLNNRLSGSVDVYTATTHDLLVDRILPLILGFSGVASNLGELRNNGFEFTLTANPVRREHFNWNTSFIFMQNRRKIVTLYGDMVDVLDAQGNVIGQKEADDVGNKWFIGQDPDRIWDYERAGVWQLGEETEADKYGLAPGDFKYVDQNGDGVLTDADKVFQRWKTPRFRWSWRNEINYRDFALSFFIYSNWGQTDLHNRAANNSSFPDRATDYATPRWTRDNPINDYARIGSKNVGNNYVDRSFIRLDNISLTYTVPSAFLAPYKIQGLRVSGSVRNAAFYAPHWDFGDPESGAQPTPRTYNLSLNFSL